MTVQPNINCQYCQRYDVYYTHTRRSSLYFSASNLPDYKKNDKNYFGKYSLNFCLMVYEHIHLKPAYMLSQGTMTEQLIYVHKSSNILIRMSKSLHLPFPDRTMISVCLRVTYKLMLYDVFYKDNISSKRLSHSEIKGFSHINRLL